MQIKDYLITETLSGALINMNLGPLFIIHLSHANKCSA